MSDLAPILPEPLPGFDLQADTSGPLPTEHRYQGCLESERVVHIGDHMVLTAMATAFSDALGAEASVGAFTRALFADREGDSVIVALDGLERLGPTAEGAVASGLPDGPGALAMLAWSVDAVRLDLSLSVLVDGVSTDSIWEAFPRSEFDGFAHAMTDKARGLT